MMEIKSGLAEKRTTRRGFFLGVLGLAGAAWTRVAGAPRPAPPPAGPVDNIFEPLKTRKTGEDPR